MALSYKQLHEPVSHGNVESYRLSQQSSIWNGKSTEYLQLNELCVRKVSSVTFSYLSFFLQNRCLWTFQFSFVFCTRERFSFEILRGKLVSPIQKSQICHKDQCDYQYRSKEYSFQYICDEKFKSCTYQFHNLCHDNPGNKHTCRLCLSVKSVNISHDWNRFVQH